MDEGIKSKPFQKLRLDEDKEKDKFIVFTVKMNKEEYADLEEMKIILNQKKDSTALKQLAVIGSKVLLDEKVKSILEVCLNNYRKNKRLNIVDFE